MKEDTKIAHFVNGAPSSVLEDESLQFFAERFHGFSGQKYDLLDTFATVIENMQS